MAIVCSRGVHTSSVEYSGLDVFAVYDEAGMGYLWGDKGSEHRF